MTGNPLGMSLAHTDCMMQQRLSVPPQEIYFLPSYFAIAGQRTIGIQHLEVTLLSERTCGIPPNQSKCNHHRFVELDLVQFSSISEKKIIFWQLQTECKILGHTRLISNPLPGICKLPFAFEMSYWLSPGNGCQTHAK